MDDDNFDLYGVSSWPTLQGSVIARQRSTEGRHGEDPSQWRWQPICHKERSLTLDHRLFHVHLALYSPCAARIRTCTHRLLEQVEATMGKTCWALMTTMRRPVTRGDARTT